MKPMTALALTFFTLLIASPKLHAQESWFFHPGVSVGTNSAQGSYVNFGIDLGVYLDENFYTGVGGFYGAGVRPEHDRAMGGGPFLGYSYRFVSFLSGHLREDIQYVDERVPILNYGNPDYYTHDTIYGIQSATYAGVHFSFTDNFGFSLGYRWVVGISRAELSDGRSGVTFGLTLGI